MHNTPKKEDRSVQAPSVSLPKGGGAIKGIGDTFKPNTFTGTGSYTIPFPVSTARGFEPSLSLSYNSGSGNGIFGLGLSLSLPKISLRTSLGIPKYDGTDVYLFNGSELVKKNKAAYKDSDGFDVYEYLLRVEGTFSLITHHIKPDLSTSYWKVINTNNQTSVFGKTGASQINNPKAPEQIFEWLLCEAYDAHGNHRIYTYKAENKDNVPDAIWTVGHSYNNKYPQSIQYGNYVDQGNEKYAFEVIFDYGEYSLKDLSKGGINPYLPSQQWSYRPDPFSSYTSGFEIRTCRLCKNILLFHHFENELGDPCLVKSLSLQYTSEHNYQNVSVTSPSTMASATLTGYRREGKKATDKYLVQSMPALKFGFSAFKASKTPTFDQLKVNGNSIPGYLNARGFLPVDLNREGISGLLYNNGGLAYLEPEGDGNYSFPKTPDTFPVGHKTNDQNTLVDLEGNGELELVTREHSASGYYQRNKEDQWDNFKPFQHYPTDLNNPVPEMAGLNHNGKSDLVITEEENLLVYESLGKAGYAAPKRKQKQSGFPLVKENYQQEYVGFVDLLGDGLPHRVKIANGNVECWPNLGYGNFAEKIALGNAPRFDENFDTTRLFFADVDGSGTTDIVYVHPDRIELFINENGNAFSDAISIILPETFSDIDQISFSDILGNGTTCLMFTKIDGKPRHYFYDFIGEIEIDGRLQPSMKPYLLNLIDNSLGATTQIQYCSSTRFYLEDKKAGRPWITKLPFPVQVVEKTIVTDKISNARFSNRFKYHDGFYDSTEREFRGFGYVETWDTEEYDDLVNNNAQQGSAKISNENYVPPVYTRTWFHTGASFENKAVSAYYKKLFFQDDTKAYDFPEPFFQEAIYAQNTETLRQAYVALKGQVIRTEVYGEDKEQHPNLYQNPFTVEQTNVTVVLYQPMGNDPYAIFLVNPRESISYQYERNPEDPRITQQFTLKTDEFGNAISACTLYLPRRSGTGNVTHAGQLQLLGTFNWNRFVTPPSGYLFCHQACEQQSFQLFGIDLEGADYFTFDKIKSQTQAIDVLTGKNIIPYSGQPTSGVQAQQLTWEKVFFWDEQTNNAGALGFISLLGLLHHKEHAAFDKGFSEDVYDGRLIDSSDYDNQGYLSNLIYTQGGYFFDENPGYWWNKGLVQKYLGKDGFYLSNITENTYAFDTQGGSHPQDISLCSRTTVEYDTYFLIKTKASQLVDQSTENVTEVLIDYITFQPRQLTDINGNIHQALFDPLGQVIVTSLFGTEKGIAIGNMTLYPSGNTEAEYKLPDNPSFADVTNPATQANYLQGASTYFYYNLDAWENNQQPACAAQLVRFSYWNSPDKDNTPYCQSIVEYSDGLGKVVEKKLRTTPGLAYIRRADGKLERDNLGKPVEKTANDRWITSGRSVYNNKGKVYEQYLPYFIDSPLYQGEDQVPGPPPTVTIYDALSRPIRVNSPKGFFSKVEFTPWQEQHFDEDDTVLDSEYYKKNYPNNISPSEKDAIDQAIRFFNTPSTKIYDNTGSVLFEIVNNLGNVDKEAFKGIVSGDITSQEVWDALKTACYLKADASRPKLTWVTDKFQPYTRDFKLQLPAKFDTLLGQITDILKQNGLVASHTTDILGRTTESIDPRLYYSNVIGNADYYNFRYQYTMGAKDPEYIASTDAGTQKHFLNIFGKQLWSWSPRDYCQLIGYDRLHRKTTLRVKKITTAGPVTNYNSFNLVEIFSYGDTESNASANNLKGQLIKVEDLSGIVHSNSYSMREEILETSRQMASNYKTAIDWNKTVDLDPDIYTTGFHYNAIELLMTQNTPDNAVSTNKYNLAGQLISAEVTFADRTNQSVIEQIDYDAKGQRTFVQYGNGIKSTFTYEETTLRLFGIKSTRPAAGGGLDTVQDLSYTYDPQGNVTQTVDGTIATVFHANQKVEPVSNYSYDALYRLTGANGRQHININDNTYKNNTADGSFMQSIFGPPPSTNDAGKLENYTAQYTYDDSGNLISKKRLAKSGNVTRSLPVEADSNHLSDFSYDASGNMRELNINSAVDLSFNCCENLVKAATITRPGEPDDADYYMYDSNEQRTRKTSELWAHGAAVSQIEDKIYLGNYEVKRNYQGKAIDSQNLTFERQTLRVMDGNTCVAIVNYIAKDKQQPAKEKTRQFRFQMDNHLGSVTLEMDQSAQLISYEEYFPYGGTAIITGISQAEVKLKEYRYSGKERDNSTGLYYYGMRYYAPWLGRWLKPDPAGTVDGMNLYAFVKGNPISSKDPDGEQTDLHGQKALVAKYQAIMDKDHAKALQMAQSAVRLLESNIKKTYSKGWQLLGYRGEINKPHPLVTQYFGIKGTSQQDANSLFEILDNFRSIRDYLQRPQVESRLSFGYLKSFFVATPTYRVLPEDKKSNDIAYVQGATLNYPDWKILPESWRSRPIGWKKSATVIAVSAGLIGGGFVVATSGVGLTLLGASYVSLLPALINSRSGNLLMPWGRGGINLYDAPHFDRSNDEVRASTLVHEASHRIVLTDDHAYEWEKKLWDNLTPTKQMYNADSYGFFARMASKEKIK
ncbi:SpvB/TcaC N-terminal domain-containing protein [Fulvivirgaceae bacterium BMA10]|uniref:SpvB/TcaC N-terminal domain-containing protein n=1 Tax=Splendidivirga corallicola TaxID=3051826 RepID=A0ABT8KKP0_9BACT|nr:SpvB/TcaC N-terminal domain-containing protein [Fulvivirgaceae bacterium BMA10]